MSVRLLEEKDGKIFTVADFQELRNYPEAFGLFYSMYVREVVGKKKFDDLIHTSVLGEEISTPTDDAFALLVLENNEDMWLDILEKNQGNIQTVKRGNAIPANYKSLIVPKYTFERGELKQWSSEGIKRFNELRDLIIDDRKKNKGFILNYVVHERENIALSISQSEKQSHISDNFEAANDLFMSDNEVQKTQKVLQPLGTGEDDSTDADDSDEDN